MEPQIEPGRFEKEMVKLSELADQLKDQTLPLEQLSPLLEKAMEQTALCDRLLKAEEGRVNATLSKHAALLKEMGVVRYYGV